ncbi:signal transduction histidine kinase regulating citrate/malate metabolism [Thermincola ferriacetica]|uniref:histidine kinase n=1 Tax=Thermincola ferriacetica TaxID=281456 RepID=A0A0L6W0S4_9FIRM|nr:ATP-binding protein [Thermincola ferriacetica]KNZ69066.1 signal transduction histidine kinase regulating citrate/malate metabolism [Thermincola ferriacetica]
MLSPSQFNQKSAFLIMVILLQVLIFFVNGFWGYFSLYQKVAKPMKTMFGFSLAAGVVLGIAAIYLVREIIRLAKKEKEAELNQACLKESQELVGILRTHRHDFFNHLQVIMGSIQLGKKDHALQYIKEVTDRLKTDTSISNLEHPEIAALLLKKRHNAESRGIRFSVDLKSKLLGLKISAITISQIIGNLIDHALDAAENVSADDRQVKVTFSENGEGFFLEVACRRPLVPEQLRDKIFEKGFSAKGLEGSGLGLHTVKKLTEKHGGTVSLTGNEEVGTVFTVYFPQKQPAN